jgi:putative transposase
MAQTTRFTHRHLPHWEVEHGRYFVTVRCADSLPRDALLRIGELVQSMRLITPHSSQYAAFQKEIFRTQEKYLDSGFGRCPLRCPDSAKIVNDELAALSDWEVSVPHFTIMPNHWHALIIPDRDRPRTLSSIMKRIKGRTASRIRSSIGGSGPFWQREWFDHWIRHDAEWDKCVAYIRNNPVKARLVSAWSDHPWTK